jgi:hypothetical protein
MTLEIALAEMERRTQVAEASAKKYAAAVLGAKRASVVGDLATMNKALGVARDALRVAQAEFANAASAWPFDDAAEQAYFESEAFTRELLETAADMGLEISEEDGQLMCYPSVIRVDAAKRLVTIDKKAFRNVRPTVLAAHLWAQQSRKTKFNPAPFLEALYTAWEYARHVGTKGKGPDTDVSVDRVHSVLVVAPGSAKEYSRQEFGRDLFLLESSGERRTKRGAEIHFSRATGTKTGKAITVVREDGKRVLYSSISFR